MQGTSAICSNLKNWKIYLELESQPLKVDMLDIHVYVEGWTKKLS